MRVGSLTGVLNTAAPTEWAFASLRSLRGVQTGLWSQASTLACPRSAFEGNYISMAL